MGIAQIPSPVPHLVSQQQAAEMFGVTVRTIRTWQAKGLIKSYRVGVGRGRLRIDADSLVGAMRPLASA